jgi:HD superfamily phosphodiesterase
MSGDRESIVGDCRDFIERASKLLLNSDLPKADHHRPATPATATATATAPATATATTATTAAAATGGASSSTLRPEIRDHIRNSCSFNESNFAVNSNSWSKKPGTSELMIQQREREVEKDVRSKVVRNAHMMDEIIKAFVKDVRLNGGGK